MCLQTPDSPITNNYYGNLIKSALYSLKTTENLLDFSENHEKHARKSVSFFLLS